MPLEQIEVVVSCFASVTRLDHEGSCPCLEGRHEGGNCNLPGCGAGDDFTQSSEMAGEWGTAKLPQTFLSLHFCPFSHLFIPTVSCLGEHYPPKCKTSWELLDDDQKCQGEREGESANRTECRYPFTTQLCQRTGGGSGNQHLHIECTVTDNSDDTK